MTRRNEIGLLIFEKDELSTAELNVGSMLKTPTLPMWVTISNGIAGVIFNPNQELVRSHRSETRCFEDSKYFLWSETLKALLFARVV